MSESKGVMVQVRGYDPDCPECMDWYNTTKPTMPTWLIRDTSECKTCQDRLRRRMEQADKEVARKRTDAFWDAFWDQSEMPNPNLARDGSHI